MYKTIGFAIPYVLLFIWLIFSIYYTIKAKKKFRSINIYVFESIPTVFTTLGVFGTFVGIAIGLYDFDVHQITQSIPTLLSGLKIAFFTSIIGIFFSLIFSKSQELLFHKNDKDQIESNDELAALGRIVKELQALQKAIVGDQDNSLATELIKLRNATNDTHKESIEAIDKQSETLSKIYNGLGGSDETSILTQIQKLRADENELLSQSKQIVKLNTELNSNYDKKSNEITEAIYKTNDIMTKKFEEFADLLAKNNTEALIEAIQRVIGGFNDKLNELIQKLIKENFEELNNSVKNLNDWQRENKAQVERLINQFALVADNMELSSSKLENISASTEKLVSEGSLLSKLVQELQAVMIDDTKFQDIIEKMGNTSEKLVESSSQLTKSSNELNDYMSNERNFREATNDLIKKLEEIRQLKDSYSEFWNKIEEQMLNGISILKNGNQQLLNDVKELDDEFNRRLNQSFVSLDKVLQAMVLNYQNKTNEVINRMDHGPQ